MEEFIYNNQTYYLINGMFCDELFIAVPEILQVQIATEYFKNKDFKSFSQDDLITFIKTTKDAKAYSVSKLAIEYGFEKFNNDYFVKITLPIITSIYRLTKQPKLALSVANKFLALYNCASPALYTSMAAACCDLEDYVLAKKYADIGFAKQGGSKGYMTELSLVYQRIKKNTNAD